MESIEHLHKLLDGYSVRRLKLKKLDKLLEGHEDHVLGAYILWLHEGFFADTAPHAHLTKPQTRAALFQSWCDRLRNHGFDRQHIFDAICDRTAHQASSDTVSRFHLEKTKEELRLVLFSLQGKKHRKLEQSPVAEDTAPPAIQYFDSRTSKSNDNEEYRKAIMGPNKADISGAQKPEMIEISSDSDSEVELLSLYQGVHHYSSQRSLDLIPGPQGSDRIQQVPAESKQVHSRHHDHGPRSPPLEGTSTRSQTTQKRITTKQPFQAAAHKKDSRMQYEGICDRDDTIVRSNKRMQGSLAEAIKRRQDAENQEEAAKNENRARELGLLTQKLSKGNTKQSVGESEASHAQQNKMGRDQVRKAEKPHDNYLCYRCEVPGHFLQDCPTNLDPLFDRIPVGGYKCMICNKTQAHLTSLCPRNTDPKSLTQLRLEFGTVTTRRLQGKDNYRPAYGENDGSRPEQRAEAFDGLNDEARNEDRLHDLLELGEKFEGHLNFDFRHLRAKRSYPSQQSPQDDQIIDHGTAPPSKRTRKDDRKQEHIREGGRARHRQSGWDSSRDREFLSRFKSPSGDVESSDYNVDSSHLLASLDRPRAESGRLSYWDSGYQIRQAPPQNSSPKRLDPAFSSSSLRPKKQPLATEFWLEDGRVEEIKHLFPYADAHWVDEMASFDVDKFLEEMDDFAILSPFDAQVATSGMYTLTEHSHANGHNFSRGLGYKSTEDLEDCRIVEDNDPDSARA